MNHLNPQTSANGQTSGLTHSQTNQLQPPTTSIESQTPNHISIEAARNGTQTSAKNSVAPPGNETNTENIDQSVPKRRKRRAQKPRLSYCTPNVLPKNFNFKLNNIETDTRSKKLRKFAVRQTEIITDLVHDVIIYDKQVENYLGLPNSISIPLSETLKTKDIFVAKTFYFELHSLEDLLLTNILARLRRRNIHFEITWHTDVLLSSNLTKLSKQVFPIIGFEKIVFPKLTEINLTGRKNNPSRLVLPQLKQFEMLKNYTATGPFTGDSFPSLETFNAENCKISNLVLNFQFLKVMNLHHSGISNVDIKSCPMLEEIYLGKNGMNKFETSNNFPNLKILDLHDCCDLTSVSVAGCQQLSSLNISLCAKLQEVNDLSDSFCLSDLNFASCELLEELTGLSNCQHLSSLTLERCLGLREIKELNAPQLKYLNLSYTKNLSTTSHFNVPGLVSLIAGFSSVNALPQNLPNLKLLNVHGTRKLSKIENKHFPNLYVLDVSRSGLEVLNITVSQKLVFLDLIETTSLYHVSVDCETTLSDSRQSLDINKDALRNSMNAHCDKLFRQVFFNDDDTFDSLPLGKKSALSVAWICEPFQDEIPNFPVTYKSSYRDYAYFRSSSNPMYTYILQHMTLRYLHLNLPQISGLQIKCPQLQSLSLNCQNLHNLIIFESMISIKSWTVPSLISFIASHATIRGLTYMPMPSLEYMLADYSHLSDAFFLKDILWPSLRYLYFNKTRLATALNFTQKMEAVQVLIKNCERLRLINGLLSAQFLMIDKCVDLENIAIKYLQKDETGTFTALPESNGKKEILIRSCPKLKIASLCGCFSLNKLVVLNCNCLTDFVSSAHIHVQSAFEQLASLKSLPECLTFAGSLAIAHCENIELISSQVEEVTEFRLASCEKLTKINSVFDMLQDLAVIQCPGLADLNLEKCQKLKTVFLSKVGIQKLCLSDPSLEFLVLIYCKNLTSFCDKSVGLDRLCTFTCEHCPLTELKMRRNSNCKLECELRNTKISDYKWLHSPGGVSSLIIIDQEFVDFELLADLKINNLCLDSVTVNVNSNFTFNDLYRLTLNSCKGSINIIVDELKFSSLHLLEIYNCTVENLLIFREKKLSVDCTDSLILGEVDLASGSDYHISGCVFKKDLKNLTKLVTFTDINLFALGLSFLIATVKTAINVAHQRKMFVSNGKLAVRGHNAVDSNGLLSVPVELTRLVVSNLVVGNVDCEKEATSPPDVEHYRTPSVSPCPSMSLETSSFSVDNDKDRDDLFWLLNRSFDQCALFTEVPLQKKQWSIVWCTFELLYLLINIKFENENTQCQFREQILGLFMKKSTIKIFQRIAKADSYLNFSSGILKNLAKLASKPVYEHSIKQIHKTMLFMMPTLKKNDLDKVKFGILPQALKYLSGSLVMTSKLQCPVCYEEEGSFVSDNTVKFKFFRECGHFGCEECLHRLNRRVCFICRTTIQSSFVEKEELFTELQIFRQFGGNEKIWDTVIKTNLLDFDNFMGVGGLFGESYLHTGYTRLGYLNHGDNYGWRMGFVIGAGDDSYSNSDSFPSEEDDDDHFW